MNHTEPQPSALPARRTVVLAGAATAAAVLGTSLTGNAAAATAPAAGAEAAAAGQPYASYWYPDSLPSGAPGAGITWRGLKTWRAEDDPDLAFNQASIPLAPRFTPVAVNTTARAGQARVASLVSFGPTAQNPSQGSATADYYALAHWQYIDELVFWGGSSGEGLILAPNAPIVDAAHRNGVPVLGNVFLPPAAYGGQLRWTRDLVQRDAAGGYPLADKLVEVAVAYGFDGWFINAETDGGDAALAADMLGFLRRLHSLSQARGLKVTWYDAMTTDGRISWQGALNSRNQTFFQDAGGKVSDSMFLDFRWSASTLASSGTLAGTLGRDRYELWAGVDVEANGWNKSVNWNAIVPTGGPHVVSFGFYRPEWTRNQLPAGRTPGQFHAADDRFWTGQSLDPSTPDTAGTWRAPAVSVADRSAVAALPFGTTFNTGHGLRWYDNGAVTSDTAWNHLGLQDRLPNRRWVVRTTGVRPAVTFDFADAWHGGSSLLVDGALSAPATVDLYSTRLPLTADTVVDLTYRADAGPVTVELAVATAEPATPGAALPYSYLPAGTLRPGSGWATATLRLSALLGGRPTGTVHALGIRLTAASGATSVRFRLGALSVHNATTAPAAPGALRITGTAPDGTGTAFRFAWDRAPGQIRHYELHRVLPDGSRRFLGATCGAAFYVSSLRPEQGEDTARFEVRSVGEVYSVSGATGTGRPW
ncbi:endo-beta-N-acetylglucosaminidase [Streptomyces sp. NPDC006923]|uniref:endo-beta-N-acetylglucosaminidase n=1 Tax=Streptomyces sp. NPDC006923 TaxID=3155355 RepID=UPI0033EE6DD0